MLYLTKYLRLSSQILQNPGCILRSTLHTPYISSLGGALSTCHHVRTHVTQDPSKFDPAKIMLRKGPKKHLRKHVERNMPKRRYKDGDRVTPGEVLRKQKAAIQWKAGQYVKTGRDRTLNAQVSGTIRLTTEHNPDKIDRTRVKYFNDVLEDEKKLQTIVHIVPDEQHWRFKLVEQI